MTVRVSTRAKYGIELIGRLYGESLSDVVNRALKTLFESSTRSLLVQIGTKQVDLLRETYAEDEFERFLKLAQVYPAVLSEDERRLWSAIQADDKYWDVHGDKRHLRLDAVLADEKTLRP